MWMIPTGWSIVDTSYSKEVLSRYILEASKNHRNPCEFIWFYTSALVLRESTVLAITTLLLSDYLILSWQAF